MNKLPFTPECYFCHEVPSDNTTPVIHVTFKNEDEAFLCATHYRRAEALDQLTMIRLVQTGIHRTLDNYA